MTISDWKSKGIYFNHKGHSIFYVDEGRGDVILLIHGFPTSSWDWSWMWDDLVKTHRVIALDMIGFGYSAKPLKYQYSIFDQTDIQEELLHHLAIESCTIMAHDYGDTVVEELMARSLERKLLVDIQKVCLLNGGLIHKNHKPRFIQKLLMSPIGPVISRLSSKSRLSKTFQEIFGPKTQPTEQEIDDFWFLMTINDGKKIIHKVIQYMAERKTHSNRWIGALQNTQIPTRLIDGAYDPISGKHMAEKYKELIQDADVVMLDEIGHYPQVEAPEEVIHYFKEFIG